MTEPDTGMSDQERRLFHESIAQIRKLYAGDVALYSPSVIREAALLHEDFLAAAQRRGVNRKAPGLDCLITAAADATRDKYRGPVTARTAPEASELVDALAAAFQQEGLVLATPQIRSAAAVEPAPQGPRWGPDGTGLAVSFNLHTGWQLRTNQARDSLTVDFFNACDIIAPATAHGAQEIAALVRAILHGHTPAPPPFRR